MYGTIALTIFSFLVLMAMITPFITILREPITEILDGLLIGEMIENIDDKITDGFDSINDAMLFVVLYIVYILLCAVCAILIGTLWPVTLPFAIISGTLYYFKKNK